jgi:4-amino-4-deoxy-L-arabinose transferase-like glycosyltransferase
MRVQRTVTPTTRPFTEPNARFWLGSLLVSALTVALRVPMFSTPLTVDEGGYAYVARMWARGASLYDQVWVDRPQGLLLIYRGAFAIFGDNARTVRGIAATFAALTVLAIAAIGRRLMGSAIGGVIAGGLFAVLSAIPQFEGHTANGELLSALPSSVAILCALIAIDAATRKARISWLILSGVIGGFALLVKQSAYDAIVVVALMTLVAGLRSLDASMRKRMRDTAIDVIAVFVGFALVIGLAALHGWSLGWHRWWFAVAGYRLTVENVMSGSGADRLKRFRGSLRIIGVHRIPLIGFALLGALTVQRGSVYKTSLRRLVPKLWLVCSVTAFALGGLFHAHYYVGLVAPIALVGAHGLLVIQRSRAGTFAAIIVCAALLGKTVYRSTITTVGNTQAQRSIQSSFDTRLPKNADLAAWLRAHTKPGETFYAMYANAALYYVADRPAPIRYLWQRGVERIPGALDDLAAVLDGPNAPRYIVQELAATGITGGTKIDAIVKVKYRKSVVVSGTQILEHV